MKLKRSGCTAFARYPSEQPRECMPFAYVDGRYLFPSFGHIVVIVRRLITGYHRRHA